MEKPIVQKGDDVLRQKAQEVNLDDIQSGKVNTLLKQMDEVLNKQQGGAALAAPQIGTSLRIFIVKGILFQKEKIAPDENGNLPKFSPVVFINPKITKVSKKKKELDEGCLSVEGIFGLVSRAEKVTVEAYDENGKKFSRGCSGLFAQIVQHEVDHLDGILFVDKAVFIETADNE